MKYIKTIAIFLFGLLIIGFLISILIWASRIYSISSDYTAKIVVDKRENIPSAMSNVIERVTSKGFIINETSVTYNANHKIYIIRCGGKDKIFFLKNNE